MSLDDPDGILHAASATGIVAGWIVVALMRLAKGLVSDHHFRGAVALT